MVWWQIIGWVGSALVVFSLTQARVLRFRWLNLVGAVLATAYNVVLGIWPFVVMNGAIAIIDVYWLSRLVGERHDEAVYEVVELAPDDAYLQHILKVHAVDVALHLAPNPAPKDAPRYAFLVARRDETVGAVIVADRGDGVGQVELDWVTPRFRDFTPGEFVYRKRGVFAAHGFRRLVTREIRGQEEYLARVGFRRDGDHLVREVVGA